MTNRFQGATRPRGGTTRPRHVPLALAPLAIAVLALPAAPPAVGAERELGAHEHGAAQLDIALDGALLYIDLDTPADNVLGFEHAPSTDAQREAVESARAALESGELFMPDAAADCTLESADVEIALAEEGEEHHDEEHADGEHHDGETHSDITAAYVYRCEDPEALGQVATMLFETFDGFEDVDVQLVGPGGQTGMELSPEETTVALEAVR